MDNETDLAAALIRITRLEREVAALSQELGEVRQLADAARVASIAVLEALDLQEVLDTLLDCLAQLVPFDAGCGLLLEGDHLVMRAGVGYAHPFEPGEVRFEVSKRPHLARCVGEMRSVRIDDTAVEPGWQHGILVSSTTKSWLGVPLVARGRVVGMFGLDKRTAHFFTDDHVRLAEGLAAHAALAIANLRHFAGGEPGVGFGG